jgi:hypothetical protein
MRFVATSVWVVAAGLFAFGCASADDEQADLEQVELADMPPGQAHVEGCPEEILADPVLGINALGPWQVTTGSARSWRQLTAGTWGAAWWCQYGDEGASVKIHMTAPSSTPLCTLGLNGFDCIRTTTCSPDHCLPDAESNVLCPDLNPGKPSCYRKDGVTVWRWPASLSAYPQNQVFSLTASRMSGGSPGPVGGTAYNADLICEYQVTLGPAYVVVNPL